MLDRPDPRGATAGRDFAGVLSGPCVKGRMLVLSDAMKKEYVCEGSEKIT